MSLYDDKRFILSHIRHSFITCDDTGMCETVMLNEHSDRYPYESLYHHPFEYNSDDDFDNNSFNSFEDFKYTEDEIDLLKKTELEYQSELMDEEPSQSLDIMSESYDMGIRRRSNTAQRLEKLKRERKHQSKTKVVTWKHSTPIVSQNEEGNLIHIKRTVVDFETLPPEELKLLEFDEKKNIYYETEEYRKFLFPKKEVLIEESNETKAEKNKKEIGDKNRRKSVLTLKIEQSPVAPINPFNEFTRFDGRVSDSNAHTKRVRIFFKVHENNPDFEPYDFTVKFPSSMSGIKCGSNWIEIIVLANARVCDLIGLICWHYTHLQIGPPLKPDLSVYALKIAEENGDVDNDFPSLRFTDDIERYGFPCLALVSVETERIVVTVYIETVDVFSQIEVNLPGTTLMEIVEQIKKKRPHSFRNKSNSSNSDLKPFRLEQRSFPGVSLDLNSPVSEYIEKNRTDTSLTAKFLLIFLNQNRGSKPTTETGLEPSEKSSSLPKGVTGIRLNKSSSALYNLDHTSTLTMKKKNRDPNDFSSNMFNIMKAHLYQCFEVNAIYKLYNAPVEMGISENKVEITPKLNSRTPSSHLTERIFSRFQGIKAMNVDVEDVVECHIVPIQKQIPGKQVFKIVYWNGNDFKSIKFEGDYTTVDDIVFKLQHVMKMRTSLRRNEYHTIKNRKKNISTKFYFKSKISSGSSESGSDDTIDTMDLNNQEESKNYDLFRSSKFRKSRSKNVD